MKEIHKIPLILIIIGLLIASNTTLSAQIKHEKNRDLIVFQTEFEENGFTIMADLSEPIFSTMTNEYGSFTKISFSNEGYTVISGEARLPMIRRMIETPNNVNTTIHLKDEQWKTLSLDKRNLPLRIMPLQPSVSKDKKQEESFIIDEPYYQTNELITPGVVKLTPQGMIRGKSFSLLELSPIQYNPFTGDLKLLEHIEISIQYGDNVDDTTEQNNRYYSKGFESLYDSIFLNYKPGLEGYKVSNIGQGYLIICHDDFSLVSNI